jgi:hypothetical protein
MGGTTSESMMRTQINFFFMASFYEIHELYGVVIINFLKYVFIVHF